MDVYRKILIQKGKEHEKRYILLRKAKEHDYAQVIDDEKSSSEPVEPFEAIEFAPSVFN